MPTRSLRSIVVLLLLTCSGAVSAQVPVGGTRADPSWTILEQRPGQGERCLVCGQSIVDEDVVEIRYQGRVFHVGAALLGEFGDDPDRYFSKIQARAALFDEQALRARPIATGWLWFGVYVLAGLISAAVCGYVAIARALSPVPWFFAGLVGNVAALAVLVVMPRGDATALPGGIPRGLRKVATTRAPVRCPECGSSNHPSAPRCSGCGVDLEPSVESETALL